MVASARSPTQWILSAKEGCRGKLLEQVIEQEATKGRMAAGPWKSASRMGASPESCNCSVPKKLGFPSQRGRGSLFEMQR